MRMVSDGVERLKKNTIRNLAYVGEQCINDGRLKGSYTDRTGHLRSSIGYVVVDEGRIVDLTMVPPTLNAAEGTKEGEDYLKSLARKHDTGVVLIVVAGKKYAAYVEARGYNVISSAELLAEKLISQLIQVQ